MRNRGELYKNPMPKTTFACATVHITNCKMRNQTELKPYSISKKQTKTPSLMMYVIRDSLSQIPLPQRSHAIKGLWTWQMIWHHLRRMADDTVPAGTLYNLFAFVCKRKQKRPRFAKTKGVNFLNQKNISGLFSEKFYKRPLSHFRCLFFPK